MSNRMMAFGILALALLSMSAAVEAKEKTGNVPPQIRKIGDIVIYQNEQFYCAFPSIVRQPKGELLVAFRRAPNRRVLGEKGYSHTDANSQLMLVRSKDSGKTWSREPELMCARPFGGS